MARYKLNTSQFGIVSGIRQEVSDRVHSAAPGNLFAPEARKGRLFLLTEPALESSRGKEACDLVTETITSVFYKDTSFSVTTSLRKAVIAANKQLYEHNFKAAHYQRTAVGMTCAVIREKDLYLAQVQPTQAYIASKGQLRALPAYPSWDPKSAATTLLRPNALGSSLFSEPELYRHALSPGDQLILCTSQLAQLMGRNEAERLFSMIDAESAIEELYALAARNSLNEAHVALIEVQPLVSGQENPLSAEGLSERGKAALHVVGDWLSDVTGNAALTLRRPGEADNPDAEPEPTDPLPTQEGIHATSSLMAPDIPDELANQDPGDMGWLKVRPRVRVQTHADIDTWPPSAFLGEGSPQTAQQAAITRPVIDLTDQQPLPIDFAAIPQRDPLPAPTLSERMTAPLRSVLAALATLFANWGRRRPEARPIPRFNQSTGLDYRRKPSRRFPLTALGLLLLMVAVSYFYIQYRDTEQESSKYRETIGQVEGYLKNARSATDDETALNELDKLDKTLDELDKSDLLAENLARRSAVDGYKVDAERLRASIERTSLLSNLEPVASLPSTASSDTISQFLVVPGVKNQLYFLGRESGTLFSQTESVSPTAAILMKDGDEAGPALIGPVRAVLWRAENLMLIDSFESSSAYLRQPDNSWTVNLLPGSELWSEQLFPDVETFGGNLYIWQRGIEGVDQIEKYASGEFANLPSEWIVDPGPEDYSDAVDMAIDGDIYLLRPNGSIVVFSQGSYARTIAAPKLNPPIESASRLFVSIERSTDDFGPNPGHLFIVDQVNQRIIEIDQEGTLIQQIRASSDSGVKLSELSMMTMVIDSTGRSLYIANGGTIYKATRPTPPDPREILPATTPTGDTGTAPVPTPTP